MGTIKFTNTLKTDFNSTLKKQVDAYFISNNLSKTGNYYLYAKTFLFLGTLLTCYFCLISGTLSLGLSYLLWAIIGFCAACIGMNVCHDAIHGSFSGNKNVNYLMGLWFNILGANDYVWAISHNIVHHTYTNIEGHDEDLETSGIIRASRHQPRKFFHKWQHFYAFLLYPLATIIWVFIKDYMQFFKHQIGEHKTLKHPTIQYIRLFAYKFLYYFLFLILPLFILPYSFAAIIFGFLLMHFIEGYILAIMFMLAHLVQETDFPLPNAQNNIENEWAIHQLLTSANFSTQNPIITFLGGGLNYQIEHHLFPRVSHVHYPKIAGIIRKTAQEFKLPYFEHKTFTGALQSHYYFLKKLGNQD